ncbi:MAG: class I SAM-dependent methyltransferase [Thermoproteota archaeon]
MLARREKARLRHLYDVTASFYGPLYGPEQLRKFRAISRLTLLKYLKPETILDAGCGAGVVTRRLCKRRNSLIVGIDFSEGMLREAHKRIGGKRTVALVRGDVENLPFRPRAFDLIVSLTVLQNCPLPLKTLKLLLHALSARGILVLSYLKRAANTLFLKDLFGERIIEYLDATDNILIVDSEGRSVFSGALPKR